MTINDIQFKFLSNAIIAQKGLLPKISNPFYIITPPYTRLSAGVTVLHSLCHYLNLIGGRAFIFPYPVQLNGDDRWPYFCGFPNQRLTNNELITPILTKEIVDFHFESKLTPITITPEVYDNPLDSPFIARYLLNYPGLLSPKYKTPHQFTFSYSRKLSDFVGSPYVLHIPTVDMNFFNKPIYDNRIGSCFYAGKFKQILNGDLSILPDNCVEILRSDSMSREDIRDIFQSSKVFYCFEDTTLSIEAALCGCATIFIPNEHFKNGPISSYELGGYGFAWGKDPNDIKHAVETVSKVEEIILKLYEKVPTSIYEFVKNTQSTVKNIPYIKPINMPYEFQNVCINYNDAPFKEPHENDTVLQQRNSMPEDAEKPRFNGFIKDWVLPPGITRIIIRVLTKRYFSRVIKDWILPPGITRIIIRILTR